MKDAASASIYGARAANGVIVYTTKKGSHHAKKLTVTYDGMYGVTDPGTGQAMMNPTDFAQYTWNAFTNDAFQAGKAPVYSHPQFGTGSSPVIPDYINVGGKAGVIGSVDLAAEKLTGGVLYFDGAECVFSGQKVIIFYIKKQIVNIFTTDGHR